MIYSENILLCIAIPLLISLLFTEKKTRTFIFAFVVGMVTCLLSAYISGFLKFVLNIEQEEMAVFYSPIIEEIMKLLPLLFYLFVFLPKEDSMFTAALGSGLGFATFENCCYILSSGASRIAYVMIRGLAVGVMHLVCALVLVLGLWLAKRIKGITPAGVIGALSLSTAFHGLYNLLVSEPGLSTTSGYILPMGTIVVMYIYYYRGKNLRNS